MKKIPFSENLFYFFVSTQDTKHKTQNATSLYKDLRYNIPSLLA